MKYYIVIFSFLCLNHLLYSQELKIDSIDTIKATKVTPSIKKYIQYIENLDGSVTFNSILTREIQKINYKGDKAFLIIQKYQMSKGTDIDSSFVNAVNLKPLAYHTNISSQGYKEIVEFSKNEISNQIITGDSISNSMKSNNKSFNGVITNDVIGELPFEIGKVFVLNMVNPGKRYKEYTTTIKVLGIETIALNTTTKIKCWKLNITSGQSNKGTTEWYSMDYQIQMKSVFKFGEGKKFIRTMIIQ